MLLNVVPQSRPCLMPVHRLIAVLLVLGLGVGAAGAQPGGETTPFQVLQIEPSARTAALAGSFAAVADGDVNALFYNPAVPGPATSQQVSASYLNHLSDLNLGSVAYSDTVRSWDTSLHGGLRFANWGTFEGRNEDMEKTGSFGAGEAVLTGGAARSVGPRARYGVNAHLIHAYLEQSHALALAFDVGGVYRVPERQLTVGGTLRHMGGMLTGFNGTREPLPLDLRLGLSKRLAHLPLLFTLTGYDLTNLSRGIRGGGTVDHVLGHLTFGAELQPGDVLRLRVGYNHRRSTDLALTDRFDLAGFGFGFGVTVSGLTVDYAYNSWSSLGGLHRFSLQANLGAL